MKRILTIFLIVLYLVFPVLKDLNDDKLHVWVLDVEQGDAILIRTPDKHVILVDVGPGNYVLSELGEVLPFWVRTINYLVLTHPHDDHIAAAKDLVSRYEIKEIIWFEIDYSHPIHKWLKYQKEAGLTAFREYLAGETVIMEDIKMQFIYPVSLDERRYENVNNASVAFIIEYKNFKGMFTGDGEVEEEAESVGLEDVDFLKAGHHCSNTSSSEKFLKKIRPEVAVCSVGQGNKFGHPGNQTLERFKKMGIEYYRTDLDGRIELITNGSGWYIKLENG